MLVGQFCRFPSVLHPCHKTDLEEKGLNHIDQRIRFFLQGGCNRLQTHWPSSVIPDNGLQKSSVKTCQTDFIHSFQTQSFISDGFVYLPLPTDLSKISDPFEKPVRNSWCASRPLGDFLCSPFITGNSSQSG